MTTDFGPHFGRYCQLKRASGKAESTMTSELHSHKKFWKYLGSYDYKGDELGVKTSGILGYIQHLKETGASNN